MKYIALYRVSTGKQASSGLSFEAQRSTVSNHIQRSGGELIGEFTETASTRRKNRPELDEALRVCRKEGATLIVAKLDRLARDVAFIFKLEQDESAKKRKVDSKPVGFVACDMPEVNTMTLGMMATFAQHEREQISQRTKAALKVKREQIGEWRKNSFTREQQLKGAQTMKTIAVMNYFNKTARSVVVPMRQAGATLQACADHLNEVGFKTRGGSTFTAKGVSRLIQQASVNS
jgi:DNA invertase Pin-like site-specific DNA recombinase